MNARAPDDVAGLIPGDDEVRDVPGYAGCRLLKKISVGPICQKYRGYRRRVAHSRAIDLYRPAQGFLLLPDSGSLRVSAASGTPESRNRRHLSPSVISGKGRQ